MSTSSVRTEAIFLDALGTLVELEPPWGHLARELGIPADQRLIGAVRAEMAYYREHSHTAADAEALADLRERCAAVLSRELGRPVDVATMMAAIRFRSYPDAEAALRQLKGAGLTCVCVSNWDCSLPDVLERVGLGVHLDGIVTSAGAGARKPDPAIFVPALEIAGCAPAEAIHVGDSPEEDGAAAAAAGIPGLIIDRSGAADITSLEQLADLVAG